MEAPRCWQAPMTDTPHIYVPEDRDDLRDGLYRGFHEHMVRLKAAEKKQ